MKKVTLNIPDNKYTFFLELVQSLRFVTIEGEVDIPDNNKAVTKRAASDAKKIMDDK